MNGVRTITRVTAFGWLFHHVDAEPGTWFDISVSARKSVAEMGVYVFYIAGLGYCTNLNTGIRREDRVTGMLTINMPDMDPGVYRYETVEKSQWWCIDRFLNNRIMPPVTGRKLAAGETATGKVLVASGPDCMTAHEMGYTASEECYIMIIEHDAP